MNFIIKYYVIFKSDSIVKLVSKNISQLLKDQIFYTLRKLRRKISIFHEHKSESIFVDYTKPKENS